MKEGDSTDPVVLKHESEAIISDGQYLFVERTVNFGPKGMKFAKPLILEFAARKNDTVRSKAVHSLGVEQIHICSFRRHECI